jgi:hypothetical protein
LLALPFAYAPQLSAQEEDELPARPSCNRILPEETLVYFRIRSIPELVDLYRKNGLDKMMADERLSNLWGDLYKEVQTEYDAQVKGELDDLELEQFQDLFVGEMCFALVAKRRQPMEGVMIVDVKPETETVDRLFGVAKRRLEEDGRPVETDTGDEIEINIIRTGEDRDIFYFRQQDTLYFATNRDLCAEMIANLKGKPLEKTRTFFENRKYRTIMGQCRVDKDHPPLATFFVDPIELFKASTRGEPFAAVALGFFPILGIDGLLGIGGAVLPGDADFASMSHMHLLMSSPREGLLKAISFRSGEFELPLSVPEDAGVFMATSFDIPRLYSGIETIYNAFNGEGSFGELVDRGSEEIGFDIKTDFVDLLTGTMMYMNWGDKESMAFNGASNGFFVELNDAEKFQETLQILMDRIQEESGEESGENLSIVKRNGQEYWVVRDSERDPENLREWRRSQIDELEDAEERARQQRGLDFEEKFTRAPVPAFGFLDNQFVITDSTELMDHLIDSMQGKSASLNESEHYSQLREKAEFLLGGKQPAGIMYNRPINQLSSIWNAITDKKMVEMLQEGVKDEPFVARLVDAYARNQLPPLEEMSDYFRTSGAIMTDDATGLHFLIFEMNNKPEDE